MNSTRIIGLVLLAVGAVLLVFGQNASEAPVEQLSNALTGRYTENTMWYIIGGVIALVAGGGMLLFGRRA
ncbi:MAG: DUF3185 family protein [Alphaproteobacteria bacterium]|nr:DUF3185 family protein [Alphaproteobacteria bacterium]MBU0798655.1 DUF3185 family protein [Alphaproteobacteria bacterium]MBU0885918.1 DUF3185 family protein [Alphaproteobacteria bacterium]MBU1811907.1 DUF3185 family protein [Alphaproteobacteria bacterium]MBU2089603.1 DUF3185 family protein [Alphaproteobacteria bacterium]